MPIIISGDPTKSISLTGDQSKSIQASQTQVPPPVYIIPGLEQSHWDVANAVVSGGLVDSIPDTSGVEALTLISGAGITPKKGSYNVTGWQLNGKTLPTLMVERGVDQYDYKAYQANAWASKMQNYSGAMTVAMLLKPTYAGHTSGKTSQLGSPWGWGTTSNTPSRQSGPSLLGYGGSSGWGFYRRQVDTEFRFSAGTRNTDHQLWMVEYSNSATGVDNYRFWINGVLQAETNPDIPATRFPAGGVLSQVNLFTIGGWNSSEGSYWLAFDQFAMNMAQAHIWKGALTDQQRNDVTAYLKSISGIA